ncbi:MAG: T9SS type A sorting domain-containing protein, partial [Candidatus Kapaibacterium sp.]
GGFVLTGWTYSYDGDFEGMNKGSSDIFVMKLDSNGNLTPSTSVNEQTSTSTSLLVSPNPLSTSSTITYTIDTPSLVRVELMNSLGQVIEVVFDGYRDSGTHGLPLNVSSLTSGMYYVRLTGETGVQTTQVCVVR